MISNLNIAAYNRSFSDRLAELACMEKLAYSPVFAAGKKIVDPLMRKELSGLGERIFRGAGSTDLLTSFKNMVLPAYGQMREMNGLRGAYLNQVQQLAQTARREGRLSMNRDVALQRIKDLTSGYRADKEKAFTAIGATAKPRLDMARAVLPVAGAAGLAGAAGVYMGNENNQQNLEQTLQNEPLMERIKFLISPRRSIRDYFTGDGSSKSSSTKMAWSGFGEGIGYGLRKAIGAIPVVSGALKDVTKTGLRGASQFTGSAMGHIGVPVENAARALSRRGNVFRQRIGRGWEQASGKPMSPMVDPMLNPRLQPLTQQFDASGKALTPYPSTLKSKALGLGVMGIGAGGAATGAGAIFNPDYRNEVLQNNAFLHPINAGKQIWDYLSTPEQRGWAASQFGLPMEETGPNSQWHKPQIFQQ